MRFNDLNDLLSHCERSFTARPLFGTRTDGQWTWQTYGDFAAQAAAVRAGLKARGIGKGDRVAIISDNRPEWAAAAFACYGLGAVCVPMYRSQRPEDWEYILADCGAKLLFAADREVSGAVAERVVKGALPGLSTIVTLDSDDAHSSFAAFLERGRPEDRGVMTVSPDDLAMLIYTSGTTGKPKGVMLSHGNLASNISAVQDRLPIGPEDRSLSFLPWAHVFGYTAELLCMMSRGASLAICDGVERIVPNLAEVRPTILFAVPRIFNKIHGGVRRQMAAKPAIIRALFEAGLRNARKHAEGKWLGPIATFVLLLASVLIFRKVVAKFGGRMKYAVSGGAALAREIAEFVDALGVTVYEGYGMTETSPIISCNFPGMRKLGSVGVPVPGVDVAIDPANSEIVVRGPNVMKGYFGKPDEGASMFTPDGGLRTGDMGRFDEDGYLYITGRIKEQYKLENGKYVVPGPLEEQLKLSPFVANAMIFGDNRPYNVALIVPDDAALAERFGCGVDEVRGHYDTHALRTLLDAELTRFSKDWKSYERVKRFAVIGEDFTQENGLLTPTMKLKRPACITRWRDELDRLYDAVAPSERPPAAARQNA